MLIILLNWCRRYNIIRCKDYMVIGCITLDIRHVIVAEPGIINHVVGQPGVDI